MFTTIALTIEIYLFFLLMGWGATRLILPESTRPYQFWIAPWFGLIVADISVVWCSRLGLATNQSVYLVILLGIGLLAICRFCKVPLSVSLQKFDAIIAVGSLIPLFLALYPLLAVSSDPTTISLENNDPAIYSIAADFLKSHSIQQRPDIVTEYPTTRVISDALIPGHRPGCWLILSLLASQFNLQTYQIFTLTIGVFYALTPPLITIFTWVVTRRYFAALIALTISILNVNFLYFNYQGFAGQIFAQGSFILAFLWLYLAERGDEPYKYYILPLALTISSLFTLYAEMGVFFILPVSLYVVLKCIHKSHQKLKIIKNFALVSAVAVLIDPKAVWQGIKLMIIWSSGKSGPFISRWAFPVDLVGFLSVHSDVTYSDLLLIISNLIIIGVMGFGLFRLDNKTLGISILTFGLTVSAWLGIIRQFTYGYYKATGFLIFAVIIVFSIGLASIVPRRIPQFSRYFIQFVILCFVGVFCVMASLPMFQTMVAKHLRVTPELINLSEVSVVAKKEVLYLGTSSFWEQFWAINFLDGNPIVFTTLDPYFPLKKVSYTMGKNGFVLIPNKQDEFILNTDEIPWKNKDYLLTPIDKIIVKKGKNWWKIDNWWLDKSDSKIFHWLNQDATLEIENKWKQLVPIRLSLKLVPIQSKTTVDVYLNNNVVETIRLKDVAKFYPVSGNFKPGNNEMRFHVREGAIQPPGDTRQITFGINAIRFATERE
ncbi:MAG: hypothetical protein WBG73_16420 [Coleofasciculaceae cyanobacterium]